MSTAEGRPEKITMHKVFKNIGELSMMQQLDRLPKTKLFLEEASESKEEHRIKKRKWAIAELKKEGKELREWVVNKKAGIPK